MGNKPSGAARKQVVCIAGAAVLLFLLGLQWGNGSILRLAAFVPDGDMKDNSHQEHRPIRNSNTAGSSSASTIFEYLPWEVASIPNATHDGICTPPSAQTLQTFAVHPICCIGSRYHFSPLPERFFGRKCAPMDHVKLKEHVLAELATNNNNNNNNISVVCDICRIMELCAKYNLSIAFWGDSVQAQIFNGFECALQRQGDWTIVDVRDEARSTKGVMKVHAVSTRRIVNQRNETTTASTHATAANVNVGLRYYYQFKPNPTANDTYHDSLKEILDTSDILIVNFGLHFSWTKRHKFQLRMQQFWETLGSYNASHRLALLAFRETTAQHFDAQGGDYHLAKEQEGSTMSNGSNVMKRCVPMKWGPMAGWSNIVAEAEATKAGFQVLRTNNGYYHHDQPVMSINMTTAAFPRGELAILPFFNFTSEHYDLHPLADEGDDTADCTHYCSTPYLWMPLWRSLRLALERKLELSPVMTKE
jgi:hypothetical protein